MSQRSERRGKKKAAQLIDILLLPAIFGAHCDRAYEEKTDSSAGVSFPNLEVHSAGTAARVNVGILEYQ